MKRVGCILVLVLAPSMSWAEESSTSVAINLGSVIASEEFCGLKFQQTAIATFIDRRVKADDLGFASSLQMMTGGQKSRLRDLSESARTAHCTQIQRVAKSYGFIN